MGKDPTNPGRNCQEKQNSLLAVTSPPARETSAMSSITEQLVSPFSCHCTDQVLGCQTPLVCCFARVECKSRRNKHRAMSTAVLAVPFRFSSFTRHNQFGNLQRMLIKNRWGFILAERLWISTLYWKITLPFFS